MSWSFFGGSPYHPPRPPLTIMFGFLDQHEYFHAYNSGVGLARAEVLPINSGEGQCVDLWDNGQIVRKKRGRFKKDGGETLCARCRAKRRVH
jgi:hypothetical protein